MSDDTNLSGMDFESAQGYIFEFMTSLKQTEKEIQALQAELDTWKRRVELAASKAMPELQAQAQAQADEVAGKLARLELERRDLASKIEAMRGQLPMLKASERSVDPDALLASMQMTTGELLEPGKAATEGSIKGLEAEAELDALRKKMGGSGDSGTNGS